VTCPAERRRCPTFRGLDDTGVVTNSLRADLLDGIVLTIAALTVVYAFPAESENEAHPVHQETATERPRDVLSVILRDRAQKMLQAAVQKEVDEYLFSKSHLLDEADRKLVVRNGALPEREVITGLNPVSVRHPPNSRGISSKSRRPDAHQHQPV
jgi:hypothetical protein